MKIIVNADDFGLSHGRNIGVDYCLRNGIATQASIIMNSLYSSEAIDMARGGGYMDKIGLHLNVASGQAMSQSMKDNKEYCKDGMFHVSGTRSFKMVFKISSVSELREEFDAQINSFFSSGFSFKHIDVHCDMLFNRPVLRAIIPLLDKYGFESVRGIEPYLFCYYKKRGIRYAPIKYYYKWCFLTMKRLGGSFVLHGGRNINMYYKDKIVLDRGGNYRIGRMKSDGIYEVIIHPDFDGNVYYDTTNLDSNRNARLLEDTIKKLSGIEKTTYKDLRLF